MISSSSLGLTLHDNRKTSASREFSVISRAKTFANFEFRLCRGRNFREKCQEMRKSRKFLPSKVSAPKVSSGILFPKIGIRNGYVFEGSMAGPRPKSGQVHPLGKIFTTGMSVDYFASNPCLYI